MKLTTEQFSIEWSNEEIEQFIKRFTPYSLNQELRIWNTDSWKISKDIKIQDIVRALQTITK